MVGSGSGSGTCLERKIPEGSPEDSTGVRARTFAPSPSSEGHQKRNTGDENRNPSEASCAVGGLLRFQDFDVDEPKCLQDMRFAMAWLYDVVAGTEREQIVRRTGRQYVIALPAGQEIASTSATQYV